MTGVRGRAATAVLGPGGVGGLLAALLARQGERVVCLAGEETAAALRDRGITVRSKRFGDFSVAVETETALSAPVAACLVAVKATALQPALQRVPPAVLADGLIVPLLNGVEHVTELRRRYPADSVVPATIRVESTRVAPGEIEHDSPFASLELAPPAAARNRTETLVNRLAATGLDVRLRDDEAAMLWGKLSFLAPLALLTTTFEAPAGAVRTEHRDEMLAVIGEVAAVATATGTPTEAKSLVALFDGLPASMESSMQRDAAAGRATEIDAIGGAVLRAAQRASVPVPATQRLVEALHGSADARPRV